VSTDDLLYGRRRDTVLPGNLNQRLAIALPLENPTKLRIGKRQRSLVAPTVVNHRIDRPRRHPVLSSDLTQCLAITLPLQYPANLSVGQESCPTFGAEHV
jgi:hypothetical protein